MKNITRRQFLKGTFAGAAGLALSTMPALSSTAFAEQAADSSSTETVAIPETWDYETDIIPGSCDANNIWSGRHAAQMAVASL